MLLLMIERGLPINTVLWADTDMEFPEMYDHISKVDDYLYRERGIHITMLRHPKGFEYLMFEEEKQKPSSIENRQRLGVSLYGNGWPGAKVRWCTGQLKTHLISKEVNRLKGEYQALHYVGIAADEPKRIKNEQYPLVDWGITEAEALKLCYDRGYDWGGLYEIYHRCSCWCCPLQRIDELRKLRHHHPELWKRLRDMDQRAIAQFGHNPLGQFKQNWTVERLEQRFAAEDAQISVFLLSSGKDSTMTEKQKQDRAEFVRVVQEAQSSQQTTEVRKQRTRLATAKQRVSELEVLLCKIYEDNILGKLSDSRYATLDAQYEKEQTELTAEISVLEKAIKSYEKHEKDADRFIALIDKYENFDKLTIAMLNEFIEKILVHERDRKGSIQTTQEVEIYFNFVGRFVPPAFGEVELTPEELEEIRKREERKDRLHQNYLKRKANGKQKEYEERTKAKKKAEIETRKQAIRTEDIARGVFIPVSSLPQLGPRKGA